MFMGQINLDRVNEQHPLAIQLEWHVLAQNTPLNLPTMWEYSAQLIAPEMWDEDPSRAQKDPSVVFYEGR